jgi:hypothetical protein
LGAELGVRQATIDILVEKYRAKYSRAVECLVKDRDALLAFYDFPAEHWDHLRTTNPIESAFAICIMDDPAGITECATYPCGRTGTVCNRP